MLASIRVKNFALVEDTEINLEDGLTVFTGETGAGKSLLLNAIVLLLGSRASTSWVRKGALKAEVEGQFYIPNDLDRIKKLTDMGFEFDDPFDPLVVRREFASSEGTVSRIWIQGKAATRTQLQEALGDMVEVSGQHEFLRLNKASYILEIVDSLLENNSSLVNYKEAFAKWRASEGELVGLNALSADNLEYLRAETAELADICTAKDLSTYEETLERQAKELSSKEKILEQVDKCSALLEGVGQSESNVGVNDLVRLLDKECQKLSQYTLTEELSARLDTVSQSLGEFESELLKIRESFSDEGLNTEEILATLSRMKRLKRKYNLQSATELAELYQKKSDELSKLENLADRKAELLELIVQQKSELEKRAKALTAARKKVAEPFVIRWEKSVQELGMPHATFLLKFHALPEFSASGRDQVELLFSSNRGHELMPLAKVASGGELSRILLGLKEYVAQSVSVGVYLFDEVDTGIGGETAHVVGKKLAKLGNSSQVLVVTHLPQIAAFANSQVLVEKSHTAHATKTELRVLNKAERLDELARMLGGQKLESARKLAADLMKRVKNESPHA